MFLVGPTQHNTIRQDGHPAAGHRDGLRRIAPESKYFTIDLCVHPLRQTEKSIFCYLHTHAMDALPMDFRYYCRIRMKPSKNDPHPRSLQTLWVGSLSVKSLIHWLHLVEMRGVPWCIQSHCKNKNNSPSNPPRITRTKEYHHKHIPKMPPNPAYRHSANSSTSS